MSISEKIERIPLEIPKKEEPKKNFMEISCPYCAGANFVKRGTRKKKNEVVQLYLCGDCKKTFTPGATKGKHYPMGVILDAMSLYYLGYSLEEACRIANKIAVTNKKSATNADSLASTNLVRSSGLSSIYNTTRTSKICQMKNYPQDCGDEGNRTPGLLDDKPESAPSHPHNENIIPQNESSRYQIGASTLNAWLEQYQPICPYARMRSFAVKMFPPKEIISSATLAHRQLYRFRHHRAKTILIIEEDWKHSRFWPLKDFLDLVPVECPHQYFQRPAADIDGSVESKSQKDSGSTSGGTGSKSGRNIGGAVCRASDVPITFSKTEMIVRGKNNFANKIAKFVLESVDAAKDRHDALQRFMLATDSVTVATEVPVYIRREDLLHMKTQLGFELYKKEKRQKGTVEENIGSGDSHSTSGNIGSGTLAAFAPEELPRLITGHIDFVQVRNGQIHILDYKPNAAKERPIEQLTIYALALSRLTGLKVFNFKCAWFDEKDYFEFYPLHVVYKKSRKRKTRKIATIEGNYKINDDPKRMKDIRAEK